MSEAIELFKKDGSPAGIFYCSECHVVFKTEDEAKNCHGERLCRCGSKIERKYQSICDSCQSKKWNDDENAKELARFEKARKITEAEYDGALVYLDERFFDCVEEAIDEYLPGQEPEYVWACENVGVPLANADSIIDHLLENMWEDAESSDLNGVAELDVAIDAFNAANRSVKVYRPDYTTAILVGNRKSE
jgi:hypothetical protein